MVSAMLEASLRELNGPLAAAGVAVGVVGTYTLLRTALALLTLFYKLCLRPGKNLKRYGAWAVVTGCTDGIGKATTLELAKKGFKLVLLGRSQEKLDALLAEIAKIGGGSVETKVIVVDLASATEATYAGIKAQLDDLDVGLLFCCAGISYPHAKYFLETDDELYRNLVAVNCTAPTLLARAVLEKMVAKKKGAIIFTGSAAGSVLPSDPLYCMYAGSKAYVEKFARALHVEYKSKGIDVQLQAPLFVATKMASIRRPRLDAPSPKTFARASLASIGYEPVITPYWFHTVMWCVVDLLPVWFVDSTKMKMGVGIRKAAIKKAERKAKEDAEGKKGK